MAKAVEYEIRTNGAQAMAELKKVGASFDEVARKAKELNKSGSGVDSRSISRQFGVSQATVDKFLTPGNDAALGNIKALKQMFGEESAFGNTMKMLRGGGAIAGLGVAASVFNDLTQKAEAFALKIAEGKMTAGEMASEMARNVPILGDIADGAVRVVGLLTGMTQATEAVKRAAALTDAGTEYLKGVSDDRKGFATSHAKQVAGLGARLAVAGLEGYSLDSESARQASLQRQREIAEQLKADQDKVDARQKSATEKLYEPYKDGIIPAEVKAQARMYAAVANQQKQELEKHSNERMQLERAASTKEADAKYGQLLKSSFKWLNQISADEQKIRDAGNAAMLQVQDRGFEAELKQMEAQGEERKQVFQQQLEEQMKLLPPALQQAAKARGQAILSTIEQANGQTLAAKIQQTLEQGQLATLQKLAEAGDKLAGAELKRLNAAKALREEYARLDAILNNPKASPEARAEAQRQRDAIAAREQAGVGAQLRGQQSGLLSALSSLPTGEGLAAQRELLRMQMGDQFKDALGQAAAILADPAATPEQKRQAMQMVLQLRSSAGQRFGMAAPLPAAPQLVSAESSLLMSGVADRFNSANDPEKRVEELTEDLVKLQQEMKDAFTQFLDKFGPILEALQIAIQR